MLKSSSPTPDSRPQTATPLAGWGNYPTVDCYVTRPATLASVRQAVVSGEQPDYIARGLGRAYGDSSLNEGRGVLVETRLNRLLEFDETTGVVRCEAGTSLAEIIEAFLPRGWFLPTTPGTKFVTVGGAIAADVHGKNHHAVGSFGEFVVDFELLIASGEVLTCSRTENVDVFWATIGGMGLTGVILEARFRLFRVETAYYTCRYRRTAHLDAALECFADTDEEYRYSVAWIDCLARGASLGRSVIMLANDARVSDLPSHLQSNPLMPRPKRAKTVPCFAPAATLNPWSVRAFNALIYARQGDRDAIVDYDTLFYPLDSVLHWNRIYGRRGFIQYQALFPLETSRQGLVAVLEEIAKSRKASFLAVLKTCGKAGQGMLSYLYPGHTLALDLPVTRGLMELVRTLDELLLKFGGRLYLAKDSTTTAETFARMYPRLGEFRAVKDRIDPQRRFMSSQARRLKIVE